MADLRIRNRAAALLMTQDKVLLHRLGRDEFWSLPGGGIEPGESAGAGMARELIEELGWGSPQPPTLIGLIENRFWLHERDHHEIGFYFLIEAEALWRQQGSPEVGATFPGAESWITFAWFARDALAGMDIRPYPVKDWLIMPPQSLRHHVMGFAAKDFVQP